MNFKTENSSSCHKILEQRDYSLKHVVLFSLSFKLLGFSFYPKAFYRFFKKGVTKKHDFQHLGTWEFKNLPEG